MRKNFFFSTLVLGLLVLAGVWSPTETEAGSIEPLPAGDRGAVFAPAWPEYDTTELCRLTGQSSNAAALRQNDCLRGEAAARRRLLKLEWTSDEMIRSCDSVIRHLDGGSYRALEVCLMGMLHPEESPPDEDLVPPGSASVQP